MAHRGPRDHAFAQWVAVGLMLAFGAVAILSIGAPFLLLGLVLLGVMLGRGPRWPAALGALAGAGIVWVVIGSVGGRGVWVASGLLLITFGGLAFWWLRCRPAG